MSKKKTKAKQTRFQKYRGLISGLQQKSPRWKYFALGIIAAVMLIVIFTVIFWPSNEATTARNGDTVKVIYIGTYDNGSEFDSMGINGSDPWQLTLGNKSAIPGFEKGIIGMSVNETRKIRIAPQDGYGTSELKVNINEFPEGVAVGHQYSHVLDNGVYVEGKVIAINGSIVTLQNMNSMAGLYLNFEITLVELMKAGQAVGNTSS